MRSFLHTVQKNQMLMMTPNTLGRTGAVKSFIKYNTPLKLDPKVSYVLMLAQCHKNVITVIVHVVLHCIIGFIGSDRLDFRLYLISIKTKIFERRML